MFPGKSSPILHSSKVSNPDPLSGSLRFQTLTILTENLNQFLDDFPLVSYEGVSKSFRTESIKK